MPSEFQAFDREDGIVTRGRFMKMQAERRSRLPVLYRERQHGARFLSRRQFGASNA
jgi:hypothetical protein